MATPLLALLEGAREASDPGATWAALLPWIGLAAVAALGALIALAWRALDALGRIEARLEAQGGELESLGGHAARLAAQPEGLDLRRLEHVLIDLRDGQARLHDALLTLVEGDRRERAQATGPEPADPAEALLERLHNRLHALGYERVQVVSERSELPALVDGRGEIRVEARRGPVLHKGRIQVAEGRIVDVDMRPPYALFP